uniref:Uncharacterized protein n=1 Tax=Arundo donax TaxID=35708 RepID=A0A0A9EQ89_ARUDO
MALESAGLFRTDGLMKEKVMSSIHYRSFVFLLSS